MPALQQPGYCKKLTRLGFLFISTIITIALVTSCHSKNNKGDLADTPEELQEKAILIIKNSIQSVNEKGTLFIDSLNELRQIRLVSLIYQKNGFSPLWFHNDQWLPAGDSLSLFIENSQLFGLFPQDYGSDAIIEIRKKFLNDSLSKSDRKDASLWSMADLLLTNAFFQLVKDIKLGRLPTDSISLRKDSVLSDDFYLKSIESLRQDGKATILFRNLEPVHTGYQNLKNGIKDFLDHADYRQFTIVPSSKDSLNFKKILQKRLFEGGYISFDSLQADSAQLANAVKKFQKEKGITVDGRAGEGTIRMLNTSDREKFIRIAISLDKYKMLPEKMPETFVWVNTSANYLELIDNGSVKLWSKVISGKAKTRTPVLTSLINSLITYPQWVPPPSIVNKEILPAVKRNPDYLRRKGFSLLNGNGEEVDPFSVDWSKYSKNIPYRIVQGSGDANALGVMKFVFDNKYSVYLHDTNQRFLFANSMRSLSHGCVRVQEWKKLAEFIIKKNSFKSEGVSVSRIDSLNTWLQNKQKKIISLKNRIPVFIRYITCEGQNGRISFYDDVYSEDKMLSEKYFKAN